VSAQIAVPRPSIRVGAPSGPVGPGERAAGVLVALVPVLQLALTILGALATVALVLAGPVGLPLPIFLFMLAVPTLFTIGAALSAIWTFRRTSRGRVLAVVVDYVAFLGVFLFLLHIAGVYTGMDELADTFGSGLPWMGLGLVAFLMGYLLDAARAGSTTARTIHLVRIAILAVATTGFLVAIGAPRGAIDFATGLLEPTRLGLAVAAVVLLAFLLALWGPAGKARFGADQRDADVLNGFLLISPNLLGFLGFFAGPLLFSLYVSLSEWDAFSQPVFVGLQNYLDIVSLQFVTLSDPTVALAPGLQQGYTELVRLGSVVIAAKDKLFWISLRNILVFAAIAIPLAVVPALFLASLLNSKIRGVRFFRAVYFIPSVAGVVGIAIIWKQLLDATIGWVNYLITISVDWLNGTFGLALVDPKIGWLSDPVTALPAIAIVFAWTSVGFNTVLFLAGLQGIPADLYEAASIDGANRWQRFRNITLPSVAPTTFFVVATSTILALQLFTEPYVLTSPNPGGPNNATLTPVMYLYNSGFRNFEFGYASAVAWVLFGLIFIFTLVQYRRQRGDTAGT
jgi:ABC-type sugar transport system permease subunit